MVYADLHVHTQHSDGTLTLDEVPAAAREAGVSAVAVTDHDRVHPGFRAPVEERGGVEVVAGIELRVEAGDQRLDLLGYGVAPTDDLVAETDRIQRDRLERGRAIIENVEAELGTSPAASSPTPTPTTTLRTRCSRTSSATTAPASSRATCPTSRRASTC